MARVASARVFAFCGVGLLAVLALSSCATSRSIQTALPPAIAMNDGAGKGAPLIFSIRLESGEELPFMVDTGVFLTILDESLTNQLGPRINTAVGGGLIGQPPEEMGIHGAPKLFLGDVLLTTSRWVMVSDLKQLTSTEGVRGILGMDCLKHYCIQLDFETRTVRFVEPDHLNTAELGTAFPLVMRKSVLGGVLPYVDASFANRDKVRFWVDTGFSGEGDFMLKGSLYEQVVQHHPPNRLGSHSTYAPADLRRAQLTHAEFGGERYQNLIIAEIPEQLIEVPAWMSLQFLARHQVTFNFPKRVMYLKPRR